MELMQTIQNPTTLPTKASTSVHPLRITVDSGTDQAFLHEETPLPISRTTKLIHQPHLDKLQKTLDALWQIDAMRPQHERLRNCGRDSWIEKNYATGDLRIRVANCGQRYCPRCQKQHANRIFDCIHDTMRRTKGVRWRFITLTLKSSTYPLKSQLAFLREAFRRLRQSKIWQRCCHAGVAIIETTFNTESQQWHPHLHVITAGDYIPQAQLSNAWAKATSGSRIVDVRKLADNRRAAQYLSEYVTKPPCDEVYDNPDRLREWILALRGARFMIRFGDIQFVRDAQIKSPTDPVWTRLQSLERTLELADRGDTEALELLEHLRKGNTHAKTNSG
jgi:hypothetical protein